MVTGCSFTELPMFPFGKPAFLSVAMVKGKVFYSARCGEEFDLSPGREGWGAGRTEILPVSTVVH